MSRRYAAVLALSVGATFAVGGLVSAPAHAAPGDSLRVATQKGVNFLFTDIAAFNRSQGCVTCHRLGAGLYAVSEAVSSGYTATLDDAQGLGSIARFAVGAQQPDGRWRMQPAWELASTLTSYTMFGLAAYDARISTRFSDALLRGADWLLTRQQGTGAWPEEHGAYPATSSDVETTARVIVGLAQAAQRADAARAAQYRAAIERGVAYLLGRGFGPGGNLTSEDNFRIAYVLLALRAAGREPTSSDVDRLRQRLLSATSQPTGAAWGAQQSTAADAFNTGITLFALCRAGERLSNPAVNAAAEWLNRAQVTSARNPSLGTWPAAGFRTHELSTTFATLGLSCFGAAGVEATVVGGGAAELPARAVAPATRSFTVRVTNTGSYGDTDTIDLAVFGGRAGWSVGLSSTTLTLAAGASADVTVSVTGPANLSAGDRAAFSVVANSRTFASAIATANLVLSTPITPGLGGVTATSITSGAGTVLRQRTARVRLEARVGGAFGSAVRGPTSGVVTFSVAGVVVGADVDEDGDGTFAIDWSPGASWAYNGPQDVRATFSGLADAGLAQSSASAALDLALARDTDGDGLFDDIEREVTRTNVSVSDTDVDGCDDALEFFTMRTDPTLADTDAS
jgi:hypothetical protein